VPDERPDVDRGAGAPDAASGTRTFKLVIAYDGTAFHGWQRQPACRTVQGAVEEALAVVLGGHVPVQGAGRTDAGVHARGQVGSFRAATGLPARAVAAGLRHHLPGDVRVRTCDEVAAGFDARRSAVARRYAYRLLAAGDVLWERFAWHPRRRVHREPLAAATAVLAGGHDFSAFRAAGGAAVSPCCRVQQAVWYDWEGGVRFEITADRFLYHMVRNVVGTAVALADTADPARAMRDVLQSRARARGGPTAPPEGLCLEHVAYEEESRS
jgi:tRNA pseudouridine38-40 synthase